MTRTGCVAALFFLLGLISMGPTSFPSGDVTAVTAITTAFVFECAHDYLARVRASIAACLRFDCPNEGPGAQHESSSEFNCWCLTRISCHWPSPAYLVTDSHVILARKQRARCATKARFLSWRSHTASDSREIPGTSGT